jgi:hypothetical protein
MHRTAIASAFAFVAALALPACHSASSPGGGQGGQSGTGGSPVGGNGGGSPATGGSSAGTVAVGTCTVPAEAQAEPTDGATVVGDGTGASCTAAAFEAAVQKGGVVTFN